MSHTTQRLRVFAACALAASTLGAGITVRAQTPVEPLHFHHVHLNSVNPKAAAAYYPKPFALSATATTFNGFEAVKTGNIFILFDKVATTPQNELTGPQTSVWHFGWNTPNSRQYNEKFRAMGLTIAQMWDAADGKLVDMSSDTLPGLPTQEQILEMRAKGTQPAREGGFGYLRGPDGAMIENAQSGTTERFNHVHMYHEHPNCAMNWYVTHLGAKMPARQGAPAPTPALENCQTKAYAPPTWPSFAKTGFVRDPAGGVLIDDISISIRPWPGGGLVSTRGKIVDHWAISTANLDQTVARLKSENVKFLEEIHPWGNSRAAMIEGPDRIAIEIVEIAQTRVATLAPLPTASPESVGFAPGALDKMDAGMQDLVDKKQLAGIVTLVARHGKVVQHKAYGVQSLETGAPMKTDAIARIYSMTKPVAGVAMMMLYEEGKWKPSDPIAKYIPEFANLKVFAGEKDGTPVFEAPAHSPTMGELMSHSAGFTYGLFGSTPVDKMYQASNPLGAPSLKEFINRVAQLPLAYQPGTKWVYSVSVDIQGYLVEKLSGKTFPEFLRTRLFDPLGMNDTGFLVPAEKLSRVATIYSYDRAKAGLVAEPLDPAISQMPGLPSGGGGLYSTASDYFHFAQMVLNGGEFNGKRYLKKATVDMMRTNVLSSDVLNGGNGIGQARFSPAQGFGYDFAVVLDPDAAKRQVGKNSFWWWGIAGTWFWIDPTNDLLFVGIIQRRSGAPGTATTHEDISRRVIAEALQK